MTNKNWVLGNEHFKRQIEELAGRHASPARRGSQPESSSANRARRNAAFRRYGVSSLTRKILAEIERKTLDRKLMNLIERYDVKASPVGFY